jgi:hypothetical protein
MRTVVFSGCLAVCLPVFAVSQVSEGGGRSSVSRIPYASVDEAWSDLKGQPEAKVVVRESDQWVVVSGADHVEWSFVPKTHEAYPALVRREVRGLGQKDGQTIHTAVLCQAEAHEACERLVEGLFKADSGGESFSRAKAASQTR